MFFTVCLPLLFVVVSQYINVANAILFPVANVLLAPEFVVTSAETPSIWNTVPFPVSAVASSPNAVAGLNPSVEHPAHPPAVSTPYIVLNGFNPPYVNIIPSILESPAVVTVPFSPIPAFQPVSLLAPAQVLTLNTGGINSGAAAFIQEAYGIIETKSVLNGIFNLQELPPLQLRDAYFHSFEHTFEEFQVPDAVNISSVASQTICSVADAVSPPLFLNATLNTIGTFLADQGILIISNALSLAQSYSKALENALTAASAAGTSSPHIVAIVDGGAGFFTALGVSIHDHANELVQSFDENLIAAKQLVEVLET